MPDKLGNYSRNTLKSKTLGTEEFVGNVEHPDLSGQICVPY